MTRLKNYLLAALFLIAAPATAQDATKSALLNPNSATEAQLAAMPHMTPELVQAVVAKRPYPNALSFDETLAKTLSAQQRQQVYSRMFVPINLNSTSAKEVMLIPGMNPRLADEFMEYTPYKVIGEFRFEIGKYVGKSQVAYLERFVFVPKK